MASDYDVLVIGSGLGGLATGALLAHEGMRVLVVEQHSQIGGYAHSFRRGAFRFESGIHSVPMGRNGFVYHLLRLLGVDTQIDTLAHPSMYRVAAPGLDYSIPFSRDDILAKLSGDFPGQRDALKRLFQDMERFYDTLVRPMFAFEERFTEKDMAFVGRYRGMSFKDYIDGFLTDETLRRIFYGIWPLGVAPAASAPVVYYVLMFYVHSVEGSHYAAGGFGTIADAFASVIRAAGGDVRTGTRTAELRIDKDKVRSVVLECGNEITADTVVSNVSAYTLHNRLIEPAARRKVWQRRLSGLKPSPSAVALYLGLREDGPVGQADDVVFWHRDPACTGSRRARAGNDAEAFDHLVFLRTAPGADSRSMLLMTYVDQSWSRSWRDDKRVYAERMLAQAEQVLPGLGASIACSETASPDTFERYTGNTGGAVIGFENTCDLYGEAKLPVRTFLANLYQTGHWCLPGGGVWNVLENAYTASKIILRERA